MSDERYAAVDTGELPEPEYWRRSHEALLAARIDIDVHRDIFWEGRERPEVLAALEALAASDYRQGMLTNDASTFLGSGWRSSWPWLHLFDAVVAASRSAYCAHVGIAAGSVTREDAAKPASTAASNIDWILVVT